MTASLRSHIADVLHREMDQGWRGEKPLVDQLADALLADPTLAAIITLASDASAYLTDIETVHSTSFTLYTDFDTDTSPQISEVRALLAAWRAER